MNMPGRSYTNGSQYRYGFNGQEKSNDVTVCNYTAEFWEYDSRISRRWNLDPVVKPYESPYLTFGGNPIVNMDPNGADTINITRTTTRQKVGGQNDGHSDALVTPGRTIVTQSGSINVQAAKGEDIFKITDVNINIDENGNQTSTSKTTTLELNGKQSHFRYGGRNMKGYQDDRYALAANTPTWLLKYYADKSGGDIGILSAIAYQKSMPFAAGLGKVMKVAYTVTGVYGVFRFALSKMAVGEITDATIAKALQGSTMQTTQTSVSLPAIKRYVEMLKSGSASPAIKVADGVIVEGNHRYIAGRIMGIEPPQVPGTLAPSMKSLVKPIQQIKIDPSVWPNQ